MLAAAVVAAHAQPMMAPMAAEGPASMEPMGGESTGMMDELAPEGGLLGMVDDSEGPAGDDTVGGLLDALSLMAVGDSVGGTMDGPAPDDMADDISYSDADGPYGDAEGPEGGPAGAPGPDMENDIDDGGAADDADPMIPDAMPMPAAIPAPPAAMATGIDVLNFALNLECLEAEFYSYAAFGRGLTSAQRGGGEAPAGGRKANLSMAVQVRPPPDHFRRCGCLSFTALFRCYAAA